MGALDVNEFYNFGLVILSDLSKAGFDDDFDHRFGWRTCDTFELMKILIREKQYQTWLPYSMKDNIKSDMILSITK